MFNYKFNYYEKSSNDVNLHIVLVFLWHIIYT